MLTIAGLWNERINVETGEPLKSCVTDANKFVGEVHDCMPVPLAPQDFDAWLSGQTGTD